MAMVFNRASSLIDFTFSGLPGFTAMAILFRANTRGAATTFPLATSFSALDKSAAAMTSLGAPAWICATNVDDEPKLSRTFTLGFAARNALANAVNESVSDAAAETVTSPFNDELAAAGATVPMAQMPTISTPTIRFIATP
jgi:hypothetical protein